MLQINIINKLSRLHTLQNMFGENRQNSLFQQDVYTSVIIS